MRCGKGAGKAMVHLENVTMIYKSSGTRATDRLNLDIRDDISIVGDKAAIQQMLSVLFPKQKIEYFLHYSSRL